MISICEHECKCGTTLRIMTDFVDTIENCTSCDMRYHVTPLGLITPMKRPKRVKLKNVFNITTGRRLVVDGS